MSAADKKRALITGATSGLGREAAVQLGRRGWRIAVTGRREALLAGTAEAVESAGGECLSLPGSVSDPETVRRHYAAIWERWGGLDWAVLNAGVSEPLNSQRFCAEGLRRTFETNVFGVAFWLETALPDMIAAGSGTVAVVSSVAGWRGLPNSGAYCASKAALNTLMESVRVDLRGTGVRVVTVCPGFVKSELSGALERRDRWFELDTDEGVRRMIAGIERGKRVVHFPWQISLLMKYVAGPMPDALYDRLLGGLLRQRWLRARR